MKKGDKGKLSETELKHKARRKSIKEGMFATGQIAVGSSYVSPFAIALNASSSLVAMLTAISGLLGPLSQIFSSRLMEKYSRKKIILSALLPEFLMWLPMIAIAIMFHKGIAINILPLLVLLSFSIRIIFANIASPAWFSWMGDIVDSKFRGRWFAKRNLLIGVVTIFLALLASVILDYSKKTGQPMIGFIILFSLAFFYRFMSWKTFIRQYEPKIKLKKGYYFSFWSFLKTAPKNNFGRYAIFRFFYAFVTTISGSLFAVYLLRYIGLGYVPFIIFMYAGTFFSLLIIEIWGKVADKYGNYRVMALTSIFTPLVPLLWVLNDSLLYMFFVPAMVSGIAWAGFNLASGNFIYDNVSVEKRSLAISYYNMLFGVGTFFGAITGAILIKVIPDISIFGMVAAPIISIFIISSILRMIVVFFGISKLEETKHKSKFKGNSAFQNIILKEGKETLAEEAHQIMSIKKYLTE